MLPQGRGLEANRLGKATRRARSGAGGGEPCGRAIAALSQTPFAGRFARWQGLTGKSYVFSVYAPAECPAFCDAVVVAVARNERGDPCRLAAFDTGAFPEPVLARAQREFERRRNGGELHVHLLARTPSDRRNALADLEAAFDVILEPDGVVGADEDDRRKDFLRPLNSSRAWMLRRVDQPRLARRDERAISAGRLAAIYDICMQCILPRLCSSLFQS